MNPDIVAAEQCLSEHPRGKEWTVTALLGEGAHSKAIGLMGSTGRVDAVLLIDKHLPLKDGSPKEPAAGLRSRFSQKGIQRLLGAAGLPVPQTLIEPFKWSEGSATICSLMPGQDISELLANKEYIDPKDLASQVASWVLASRGISELRPQEGVGVHFFGHNAPFKTNSEEFRQKLKFMENFDGSIDETIKNLANRSAKILDKAPVETMIFDLAGRNVMMLEGKAIGFVDNTDVYTGDPMLAPGFAFGMLALAKWEGLGAYKEQWLQEWNATPEEAFRCELHALVAQAGYLGREWEVQGSRPEGVDAWERRANEVLAQLPLTAFESAAAARRKTNEQSQPKQNYQKSKDKHFG